ncbi:hypothetical protein SAMN05518849_12089 [Sphingobium sp. AP50]|uniref:hypothetical protein n=1 Tax=Sphingobium sp. AP50 TaxID=1884369 RepID=UPI0008D01361|nr:hypothetical protein [Sphingobium sp. AP50]SEJ95505.1 hypothetical protein SAMN05518849_12089 [Sphingobium sp. AP50]
MRVIDRINNVDRRSFIGGSGLAALLATSSALLPVKALAEPLKTVSVASAPTLILIARDLFPHDRLGDDDYRTAIIAIDEQVAADANKKGLLQSGTALLDDASRKTFGRPYLAIRQEQDRVGILKTIEGTDFFKTLRSGLVTALYNQQPLWSRFGYEGSSAEQGGYIRRGFDDIDWLPA